MQNPTVHVSEITNELKNLAGTPVGKLFGPNPTDAQRVIETRIRATRVRRFAKTRVFVLTWQDVRVPVGAEVAGHVVRMTQHGRVQDDKLEFIGSYVRLADEARERQMLVLIHE